MTNIYRNIGILGNKMNGQKVEKGPDNPKKIVQGNLLMKDGQWWSTVQHSIPRDTRKSSAYTEKV